MTDLLKAIAQHVKQSYQPESPERMKMLLYMYNSVDRRTKVYRDWMRGKLTLSEAYAKAGGNHDV